MAFAIPPRELVRRLTARELVEYEELYALDPWGEDRADLRMGILAATLVNINRDPRKGKPARPVEFMPYIDRDELKKSDEARLAATIKGVLGARAVRKGGKKQRRR